MSIPAYVVNWEELQLLIEDFLGDLNYRNKTDIKGINKLKGFHKQCNKQSIEVVSFTIEDTTILLDKILFNDDDIRNNGHWEMHINDIKIFNNVKTNLLPEKAMWNTITPINVGDTLTITFENPDGIDVNLWVDIGYISLEDRILGDIPEIPPEEIGTRYIIRHLNEDFEKIREDIEIQDRAELRKIVFATPIDDYGLLGGFIGHEAREGYILWNASVIAQKGLISIIEQTSGERLPDANVFNFIYSDTSDVEVKDLDVTLRVRYLDLDGNELLEDHYEIDKDGVTKRIEFIDLSYRNYVPVRLEIGKDDPLIIDDYRVSFDQEHTLHREYLVNKNQLTYYYKKAPIINGGD